MKALLFLLMFVPGVCLGAVQYSKPDTKHNHRIAKKDKIETPVLVCLWSLVLIAPGVVLLVAGLLIPNPVFYWIGLILLLGGLLMALVGLLLMLAKKKNE